MASSGEPTRRVFCALACALLLASCSPSVRGGSIAGCADALNPQPFREMLAQADREIAAERYVEANAILQRGLLEFRRPTIPSHMDDSGLALAEAAWRERNGELRQAVLMRRDVLLVRLDVYESICRGGRVDNRRGDSWGGKRSFGSDVTSGMASAKGSIQRSLG